MESVLSVSIVLLGGALVTGCSKTNSSTGVTDGPPGSSIDADVSGQHDAATDGGDYTSLGEAAAKVLGYSYGDGNYYPPFPAPPDLTLTSGNGPLTDFVKLACTAGYNGQIVVPKETPSQIDCATFTHVTTGIQTAKIRNFQYPASTFETFAENASPAEAKAFLSGVIPMEGGSGYKGGPNGQIEDQSIGFGPYTTRAQIHEKMLELRTLMEHGAGFTTVQLVPAGCEASHDCNKVMIDAAQEACRFNSSYGYTFIVFDRVPGAHPSATGVFVEPAPCP